MKTPIYNKRRCINIDDDIIFKNLSDTSQKLAVRVKALYRYSTFEQMFSEIPLKECGFENEVSAKNVAMSMEKYYSEDMVKRYGVLGIKMELKSPDEVLNQKESEDA